MKISDEDKKKEPEFTKAAEELEKTGRPFISALKRADRDIEGMAMCCRGTSPEILSLLIGIAAELNILQDLQLAIYLYVAMQTAMAPPRGKEN